MSYERLEELERHPVALLRTRTHPGEMFLHARLWEAPVRGRRAPFHGIVARPPVEALDDDTRCASPPGGGSTRTTPGVQSGAFARRCGAARRIDCRPEDAARDGLVGGRARARAHRAAAAVDGAGAHRSWRCGRGSSFMTFHFPDEVDTNLITMDATDPKSGTAEFKAAAVRIEKLTSAPGRASRARGLPTPRVTATRAGPRRQRGSTPHPEPTDRRPNAPPLTRCSGLAPSR